MRWIACLAGLIFWSGWTVPSAPCQAAPAGRDLQGRTARLVPEKGIRAVVLFFVASDCPISNRTLPEMRRVEQEFRARGVAFRFVYPNVTETAETMRAHRLAYLAGETAPIWTDPGRELGRLAGVTVTPEAAVLVPGKGGLRRVYAGRIDDRFLSIGNERTRVERHDLEEAIQAVLAWRAVPAPGGPAVGCGIVSAR